MVHSPGGIYKEVIEKSGGVGRKGSRWIREEVKEGAGGLNRKL